MPASNPQRPAGSNEGQHTKRSFVIYHDNHSHPTARNGLFVIGRPWWGWAERQVDGSIPKPIGELAPYGWDAPWLPPNQYINASIGKATVATYGAEGVQQMRFRIDYAAMSAHDREAMEQYYQRAIMQAREDKAPLPKYGDPIGFQLAQAVGYPPRSPKIAEACMSGNPWILGFEEYQRDQGNNTLDGPANRELQLLIDATRGKVSALAILEDEKQAEKQETRRDGPTQFPSAAEFAAMLADLERLKAAVKANHGIPNPRPKAEKKSHKKKPPVAEVAAASP